MKLFSNKNHVVSHFPYFILDIIASYAHTVQWLPKMGSLICFRSPSGNLQVLPSLPPHGSALIDCRPQLKTSIVARISNTKTSPQKQPHFRITSQRPDGNGTDETRRRQQRRKNYVQKALTIPPKTIKRKKKPSDSSPYKNGSIKCIKWKAKLHFAPVSFPLQLFFNKKDRFRAAIIVELKSHASRRFARPVCIARGD